MWGGGGRSARLCAVFVMGLWAQTILAGPAVNDILNSSKAISPQCRAGELIEHPFA